MTACRSPVNFRRALLTAPSEGFAPRRGAPRTTRLCSASRATGSWPISAQWGSTPLVGSGAGREVVRLVALVVSARSCRRLAETFAPDQGENPPPARAKTLPKPLTGIGATHTASAAVPAAPSRASCGDLGHPLVTQDSSYLVLGHRRVSGPATTGPIRATGSAGVSSQVDRQWPSSPAPSGRPQMAKLSSARTPVFTKWFGAGGMGERPQIRWVAGA